MDCSIIIVSYNTYEMTIEAIRSALRSADGISHEVIVVDNCSPDESGLRLRRQFATQASKVQVIQNHKNVGFSVANNQGAAIARGEVLFFLNPDTVVHGEAITKLVGFLRRHPEAGAVGPRVLNGDGSAQISVFEAPRPYAIIRQHLPISALLRGSDRRIASMPDCTTPVDIVKGCALALTASSLNAVGGWDEAYFMYSEEAELCYALQNQGLVNYYFPDAVITHFGGASYVNNYAEEQVRVSESAIHFLERHYPLSHVLLYRVTGFAGYAGRVAVFTLLMWLRPERRAEYRRRRAAAMALVDWFARARFRKAIDRPLDRNGGSYPTRI